MDKYVGQIIDIFNTIIRHPDKASEILEVLRELINSKITPNNECIKIYYTRNSNDPFYAIVVPQVYRLADYPCNVPCCENENTTKTGIRSYYIDIDINRLSADGKLGKLTAQEMTAWLIHEISHNILTSTAKLRIEMLLLKYASGDGSNAFVQMICELGSFLWCDIHSRTYKQRIENGSKYEADKMLMFMELAEAWNNALDKYISEKGGDVNVISEDYQDRLDVAQFKLYGEIIRENMVQRQVTYPGDKQLVERLKKYVIENVQSELFRLFVGRIGMPAWMTQEKDSFVQLDSNFRSMNESISVMNEAFDKFDYLKTAKVIDEIEFEVQDIRSIDDKIAIMYKIRDWQVRIEKLISKDPTNKLVLDLKERLDNALIAVKDFEIKEKQYGVWIHDVPPGYEG